MTIIIRLQNLPITAKSGDIRNFFGGLHIPDGGVHILGGDQGDAFIVFSSDEDARLAMRKDGGKIQNARVKLYLSSHMEMKQEVERITKTTFGDESSPEFFDLTKSKSPEKKKAHSRSPPKYSSKKSRHTSDYHQRYRSTTSSNSRSSRYRSRSPRRSRSPVRSYSPSRSSKSRTYLHRKKSPSPRPYKHSARSKTSAKDYHTSHSDWEKSKQDIPISHFKSQDVLQAELEKRITEELERKFALKNAFDSGKHQESSMSSSDFSRRGNLSPSMKDLFDENTSSTIYEDDSISFPDDEFKQINEDEKSQIVNDFFYVTMTGLHPSWNFRQVQIMLKGIYAPLSNIRFEKDAHKCKTGTCVIKLTNEDDFKNILQKGVLDYKGFQIVISECPIYIARKFFRYRPPERKEHYAPQDYDLCYELKGLPFTCTYDDVTKFFNGFQIADLLIFREEDGRATGTGFVSFTNWRDFDGAKALNGQKIAHRYIELLPCTDRDMFEAKMEYMEYSGESFIPYSKLISEGNLTPLSRPLCAILTGLPPYTTPKTIVTFFSSSDIKLDAIHVTLDKKKRSDGRALVEFTSLIDFDLALKFHGKLLDNNVVSVKHILYDEMMKILDSTNAEHHFETPASTSSVLDEPKKVPYLWEPPDEEAEKFDMDHGLRDPKFPSYSSKSFEDDIEATFNPNLGLPKSFHSTNKYEENIKSSRLSPENEAALLNFLNRDRKLSPKRTHNRSKSPKMHYLGGKSFNKARSKEKFRNAFGRNSKHGNLGYSSYQRNPERLGPLDSNRIKEEDLSEKCVVQLSNVDTSMGLNELTSFLRGFAFDKESLIRGFTNDGKPTLDVRVTFCDVWEAERAIRELDGFRFENKIISMHIVS